MLETWAPTAATQQFTATAGCSRPRLQKWNGNRRSAAGIAGAREE
jgi:hypothetical protein